MRFDEIQEYKIKRISKGIKLKEIAEYLNCTSSLISRFEKKGVAMNEDRMKKYRDYITNFENK